MGPYMFDTLSETQRKQAEKLLKGMLYSLHNSESYLNDYLAGRVNAAKVAGVITQTSEHLQEEIVKILKMHQKKA
jgi:hypothetical protein